MWELPKIEPVITEDQQHRRWYCRCGESICAALPAGVPTGQSGPRLVAFTGLLVGHFRQSQRRAAFFIKDFPGMPCCPALTVKMRKQVADALAGPYDELKDALASRRSLSIDETPARQGRCTAWLWTVVAVTFAVFAIFSSRRGTALPGPPGDDDKGIINCNPARMYWQASRLQWCRAHLQRDIPALTDHQDHQVRRLGCDLMRQVQLMFDTWWQYREGKISWQQFRRRMQPIRREVDSLLLLGAFSGNPRPTGMYEQLYEHREWLWTFVDHRRIEPTNNTAERAIRPSVIYRKLSFGTRSAAGSRFIERMLIVSETCRLQQRTIFGHVTAAVEAHFQRQQAPSLLPAP